MRLKDIMDAWNGYEKAIKDPDVDPEVIITCKCSFEDLFEDRILT